MSDLTYTEVDRHDSEQSSPQRMGELCLMVGWSFREPNTVGLCAQVPAGPSVLGRGQGQPGEEPRLLFRTFRPGSSDEKIALESPTLSRRLLVVRREGRSLKVQRAGKLSMTHNGVPCDEATLVAGDRLLFERQLLLLCVTRTPTENLSRGTPPQFAFGEADSLGFVGETTRLWQLRDELLFYARRQGHAVILGPSGSGKELCARAIHSLSTRNKGPFIARNAATLPEGLIDAELFGNEKNYPNPGMRERSGLIGDAHGGTLFLDEIGELPETLQAHLLRVLDAGEYHRLGSTSSRKADVRLVGATNRDIDSLKHDIAARLTLRIHTPGLEERREDIPLLIKALLNKLASADPSLKTDFFDDAGQPRVESALVEALIQHPYSTHLRELEALLVLAMAGSKSGSIDLTQAVRDRLGATQSIRKGPPTKEQIEACIARVGTASRAWQELGLSSRDALNRLMKKYGLRVRN